MNLKNIVMKTWDFAGHTVAAGFALDSINNALQGNYEIAVAEMTCTTGIETMKYIFKKKQDCLNKIYKSSEEIAQMANEIREGSDELTKILLKKRNIYSN